MLELLSVLNYVNFIIFLKSMFCPFEKMTREGFLDLHSLLRKLTIPLSKRRLNFDNIKLILCQSNLFFRWREATASASGRQWMTAVGQRMGKSGDKC